MKNPLKKITFKSKKKILSETPNSFSEYIRQLVIEGEALRKENNVLNLRCKSLEVTIREQQRKMKDLEKRALESKQKEIEAKKNLESARFSVAAYSDLADRYIRENQKLRQRYCVSVEGEGVANHSAEEVTISGTNGSM